MRIGRAIVERLATPDPGLARLRMASRTTLTVAAVGLALALVHAFHALPPAAYGIGLISALQGALAIRETRVAERARTRAWCAAGALVATAAVAVLAGHPLAIDVLFLAVVFWAIWLRRFGPRWNAVGSFTFMCTFMSAYLHPDTADLGGVLVAVALSSLVAHAVRNTVLPEHPARDFAIAVHAIAASIEPLRRAFARCEPTAPDAPTVRAAVRRERATRQAILAAEACLPARAADPPAERARGEAALALFDLQLAAETGLSVAVYGPSDHRHQVREAERFLERALARLEEVAATLPQDAFSPAPKAPDEKAPDEKAPDEKAPDEKAPDEKAPDGQAPGADGATASPRSPMATLRADPSLRLAVQVTLGSALAMVGGMWLSDSSWFWAMLTAFLIFTNVQSRGDTIQRGLGRAGGTLLGILVGIALATALSGQPLVAGALIAVLLFAAFYCLTASYTTFTFLLTLTVALLYGLLGVFTPERLVLRLEETLIGAAAGILVTFVVFPQSTAKVAGNALAAWFRALDALLAIAERDLREDPRGDLLAAARTLDRRYDELVAAARPLGSDWQLVRRPGRVRRLLTRLRGGTHWARTFASALHRDAPGAGTERARAELGDRIATLRGELRSAADEDDAGLLGREGIVSRGVGDDVPIDLPPLVAPAGKPAGEPIENAEVPDRTARTGPAPDGVDRGDSARSVPSPDATAPDGTAVGAASEDGAGPRFALTMLSQALSGADRRTLAFRRVPARAEYPPTRTPRE